MRRLGLALLALALLVPAPARSTAPAPRHAELGVRAGIYDDAGREVLLRGVDVNGLGDWSLRAGAAFLMRLCSR